MISQDREEIYLKWATFDEKYKDYVRGAEIDPRNIKEGFLHMYEYRPFKTGVQKDMKLLGLIVLAYTRQCCGLPT